MTQAAFQFTLETGNPYLNFLLIVGYSVPYSVFAWQKKKNVYWVLVAASSCLVAAITVISMLLFSLFESGVITPHETLETFETIQWSLFFTTIIQVYLIVRATNGYRGIFNDIKNFSGRWALGLSKKARK